MENAYSNYTRRLESLLEVCKNLSSNLDMEPFLNTIIETASELTVSESSSILVYDKESHCLRFVAGPFYQMERMKSIAVPVEQSVAGWVFTNHQPMSLHHADKDERIFRVVDRELSEGTRSLLAVPIMYHDRPLGVMETINKGEDGRYSDEDVFILDVLASQAGMVIESYSLQEETRSSNKKVTELDRLKSDFIAIASHELRTPLGLILGHGTFLAETATEEQRRDVDVIIRNAMRLKEVIEQLSDADVIEHGMYRLRKTKVSVPLLVQDVTNSFYTNAVERKVTLTMDVAGGPMVVEGDSEKLEVVLSNLIKNALTFTNEGGHIRVKAEQVPGYVKVTVADDGVGIPSPEQEKIFERFYQVEKHLTRHHGGMGLGLAIAREMIELHGGRIWVESTEGKGSKFMFLLPQNSAQVTAASRVFRS